MAFNFDNTMLCDFASCEAQALAKHKFGLVSKAEKIAADMGNAYHAGLELHFNGASKRDVTAKFEEEYDKVIPPGETPPEDRFGRKNCVTIMERYCDVRPVDKMPWIVVETEAVRGMPLDDSGEFIFWVKRDLVGKDKQSGALVPVDHKTTGKLTSWWARQWRLTSQLSGYCWFTGQEFGQPIGESYINALEISLLPTSNKRCNRHSTPGNPVKYSQCYPQHANFQIYQYTRSQAQIDKWRSDALIIAKGAELAMRAFYDVSMLQYARRNGAFTGSCTFCDFKEWCVQGFAPEMAGSVAVYDPWMDKLMAEGKIVEPGWRAG